MPDKIYVEYLWHPNEYVAYRDPEGGLRGYGPTEDAAIADLKAEEDANAE